jgi:hypothetical protein
MGNGEDEDGVWSPPANNRVGGTDRAEFETNTESPEPTTQPLKHLVAWNGMSSLSLGELGGPLLQIGKCVWHAASHGSRCGRLYARVDALTRASMLKAYYLEVYGSSPVA